MIGEKQWHVEDDENLRIWWRNHEMMQDIPFVMLQLEMEPQPHGAGVREALSWTTSSISTFVTAGWAPSATEAAIWVDKELLA